jgi:hypothetical protein
LKEHHDHLLSGTFDVSFQGSGAFDPSSSQMDPGFPLDILFPLGDDLELDGDLGYDLAKELGEGWGGDPMPEGRVMFICSALFPIDEAKLGFATYHLQTPLLSTMRAWIPLPNLTWTWPLTMISMELHEN